MIIVMVFEFLIILLLLLFSVFNFKAKKNNDLFIVTFIDNNNISNVQKFESEDLALKYATFVKYQMFCKDVHLFKYINENEKININF